MISVAICCQMKYGDGEFGFDHIPRLRREHLYIYTYICIIHHYRPLVELIYYCHHHIATFVKFRTTPVVTCSQ